MKEIYFAGGCFWGTQHYLKQIRGVVGTAAGYANGETENPTYKQVYTDATGYAETVKVQYDPAVISLPANSFISRNCNLYIRSSCSQGCRPWELPF